MAASNLTAGCLEVTPRMARTVLDVFQAKDALKIAQTDYDDLKAKAAGKGKTSAAGKAAGAALKRLEDAQRDYDDAAEIALSVYLRAIAQLDQRMSMAEAVHV